MCSGERIIGQNNISHPSTNVQVHKETLVPLSSPIATVYYLTEEGQPMYHPAADAVLGALESADVIVYAIGSLFTSIMPCLVLRGAKRAVSLRCVVSSIKHDRCGRKDRQTCREESFTSQCQARPRNAWYDCVSLRKVHYGRPQQGALAIRNAPQSAAVHHRRGGSRGIARADGSKRIDTSGNGVAHTTWRAKCSSRLHGVQQGCTRCIYVIASRQQ